MSETVGDESYKGTYSMPTTLATHKASLPCSYGNQTKMAHRQCLADFDTGAKWGKLDAQECMPKSDTTFKLGELNTVRKLVLLRPFCKRG